MEQLHQLAPQDQLHEVALQEEGQREGNRQPGIELVASLLPTPAPVELVI